MESNAPSTPTTWSSPTKRKPLGIAGVIGGWDSMITADTKNVLVEAAWFDPVTVRRSSKRHLLHTDASHRFERGADFNAPPVASALVSRILLEAGGHQAGPLTDVVIPEAEARTAKRPAIVFSLGEVKRILGPTEDEQGITASTAETILTGLGCSLAKKVSHRLIRRARLHLSTRPVLYRSSLARPHPRTARPTTSRSPAGVSTSSARSTSSKRSPASTATTASATRCPLSPDRSSSCPTPSRKPPSAARCSLSAGPRPSPPLSAPPTDAALFAPQPNSAVAMGNPLSEEAGMLRPSLAARHARRCSPSTSTATSRTQPSSKSAPSSAAVRTASTKSPSLAIGATGHALTEADVTFYDLKGTVEDLLDKFSSRSVYFDNLQLPSWLHPGRSARAVSTEPPSPGSDSSIPPKPSAASSSKPSSSAKSISTAFTNRSSASRSSASSRATSPSAVTSRCSSRTPPPWAAIEDTLRSLDIPELRSFAPKEILRECKVHAPGTLLASARHRLPVAGAHPARRRTAAVLTKAIVAAMESIGGRLRS